MVVKKGTELVKGSARKSIVPVPRGRIGDLAVRDSRLPTKFKAVDVNEIAKAAERLKLSNLKVAREKEAEKQKMFGLAKKGEWGPVFGWLEEKKYGNINERDGCGRTLLMVAASLGNWEAAKELISKEAYKGLTDKYMRSALMHALRNGHDEFAKSLNEAGASWEQELHKALSERRVLLVKSMQKVFDISEEQIAAIEATMDPNRGPALSYRVRGLGEEANAQQDLTVMFQPKRASEAAPPRTESVPEGSTPRDNSKKTYNPGTLGC